MKQNKNDPLDRLLDFFKIEDENGVSNLEKVQKNQKILRRVETTEHSKSVEVVEHAGSIPDGIVMDRGKIIGFGIRIFNEDVYPLRSFEIYLRSCALTGALDLSGCTDMVYLDLYHNQISSVRTRSLPSMRIFGMQDNLLETVDVTDMPSCQGIDIGFNRLKEIDVSQNRGLVELYVNDNALSEIDLSHNPKLKYFYCHNNRMTALDTRENPLLRHLNATGNPLKTILSLAPQREDMMPLELHAGEGGCVGLNFNPIYNAQWKETGRWEQSYHAYPDDGFRFEGWYENGAKISAEETWTDGYGTSRSLIARFDKL